MASRGKQEFAEWVTSRQSNLIRAARAICFDSQNAEDVLQEALLDIYKRWNKVREYENLEAYVIKVMVSKHVDMRRKWARRAQEKHLQWDAAESLIESIDDSLVVMERVIVQAALRKISAAQRAVLFLIYEYGMSIDEASKHLEIPKGTAASHLARGREAVAKVLNQAQINRTLPHTSAKKNRLEIDRDDMEIKEIIDAEVIEE